MKKVMLFIITGIVLGAIFGEKILVIDFFGKIFLSLMMMAAIPMVVISLLKGIAELGDVRAFGRVGVKIMIYYCFTTVLASGVGLAVANFMNPGKGFEAQMQVYEGELTALPGLGQIITAFIPSNIFSALAGGRLDQIVVYCAFAGIAIVLMKPEPKAKVIAGLDLLSGIVNNIMQIVLGYAPVGIGCLMATTVGRFGSALLGFAAKYIAANYISYAIMLVVYTVILTAFTGGKAFTFLKKGFPGFIMAFSTSSSLATVPTNLKCAESMGISESVYSFTIPLGAQINKDGTAIIFATNLLFAASIFGIKLTPAMTINAMFLILMLTTGQSGVPGSGSSSTVIMFNTLNIPLDMVGMFTGLVPAVDMGNTAINCYGDLVGTSVVAYSENKYAIKHGGQPLVDEAVLKS
ncbi:MAG: dicarboxylate/amino acid:cation symporter [Clostridium sp.]|nr:dicarboxylate/amino acid:cation symporter [Clostridium sp.]